MRKTPYFSREDSNALARVHPARKRRQFKAA